MNDLRSALRALRSQPGFTLLAILILALGIGANSALFGVVNNLLLKPLPFPKPDGLVFVWLRGIERPDHTSIASKPNFLDWQRDSHSFSAMATYAWMNYNLSGTAEPEQVPGLRTTASLFQVLGVEPQLGRLFRPEEEQLGRDQVVVISDGLWRRRFGGDPSVVGRPIRVDGKLRTLIGVMPPRFQFPDSTYHVWAPIAFNEEDQGRGSQSFEVVARLKPGVSVEQANAEMDTMGRRMERAYPENRGWTIWVQSASEFAISDVRTSLEALMGAVGLVLLIACANVANLLLARGAARRKEMAIRVSLGASRGRITRQLLVESLMLAAAGGVAGMLLAPWIVQGLVRIAPPALRMLPFRTLEAPGTDPRVLLFTIGVSFVTGMVFGLLPAWSGARTALSDALNESGARGATGTSARLRATLVGAEVALAIVVTTGAGMLIASITRLLGVAPGLDPKNVQTMQIALPQADFYGLPERPRFCQDLERNVATTSGVLSVSAISHLPFSNTGAGRDFTIEGRTKTPDDPWASYRLVCPAYFRTMGIPLRAGREFTDRDAIDAVPVAIINQTTLQLYFPGEDPVGRKIRLGGKWRTIVGVAGDVHHFGLDGKAPPEVYLPYSQAAWPVMTIVTRAAVDPAPLTPAIRAAVAAIDRDLPISRIQSMQAYIDESLGPREFPMQLLSAFAGLALLLAALGIFGVMSWFVTMRTREIGIRVALGARLTDVTGLVLGHGLRPVAVGAVAGVAGSLAAARVLKGLLYEVKPGDPWVLASVTLLLGAVAALAAYLPARRAARVDPVTALRYE